MNAGMALNTTGGKFPVQKTKPAVNIHTDRGIEKWRQML